MADGDLTGLDVPTGTRELRCRNEIGLEMLRVLVDGAADTAIAAAYRLTGAIVRYRAAEEADVVDMIARRLIGLLITASLCMAGCAALLPSIREGAATQFTTGDAKVVVNDGQLPDLGAFTFTQGGRYDGWAMDNGTNDDIDGSKAVFESDTGWQLMLSRFGRSDDVEGVVTLRDLNDDQSGGYVFWCDRANLVTTTAEFSGLLTCHKALPAEPPPLTLEIDFSTGP